MKPRISLYNSGLFGCSQKYKCSDGSVTSYGGTVEQAFYSWKQAKTLYDYWHQKEITFIDYIKYFFIKIFRAKS